MQRQRTILIWQSSRRLSICPLVYPSVRDTPILYQKRQAKRIIEMFSSAFQFSVTSRRGLGCPRPSQPFIQPRNSTPIIDLQWRAEVKSQFTDGTVDRWRQRCYFTDIRTRTLAPNSQWHQLSLLGRFNADEFYSNTSDVTECCLLIATAANRTWVSSEITVSK